LVFTAFHVLLFFRIMGVDWCNATLNMKDEDDDEKKGSDDEGEEDD
jgi:hypothetical protein